MNRIQKITSFGTFQMLKNIFFGGSRSEVEGSTSSTQVTPSSSMTSMDMPPMPSDAFLSHQLEADFEDLAQPAAAVQVSNLTLPFPRQAI